VADSTEVEKRNRLARFLPSIQREWPIVLRFAALGFLNTAVSYLVFVALFKALSMLQSPGAAAQFVSYGAGMATSYMLNRSWTFCTLDSSGRHFVRFLATQALCLMATVASLGVLVDRMGYSPSSTWLVVNVIVAVANFLLQRLWVFGRTTVSAEL